MHRAARFVSDTAAKVGELKRFELYIAPSLQVNLLDNIYVPYVV